MLLCLAEQAARCESFHQKGQRVKGQQENFLSELEDPPVRGRACASFPGSVPGQWRAACSVCSLSRQHVCLLPLQHVSVLGQETAWQASEGALSLEGVKRRVARLGSAEVAALGPCVQALRTVFSTGQPPPDPGMRASAGLWPSRWCLCPL